jgi:tetratricopeptide (TPR) repeat protein
LLYQEWAHLRKGHALMALKRYTEAYAEFEQYLKGVEGMRARDPGYLSALYDEANAYQWMGDALRLKGNAADADKEYRQSLRVALDGVKRVPSGNQAAKKILAMAYYRLGMIDELEGRKADAVTDYRACAATIFNNATWTPRSTWPEDVALACREKVAQLDGNQQP